MALEWAASQALRHFIRGQEIPIALLDEPAIVALKWIGSYQLANGQMPSDEHLDNMFGADLTELQAWTSISDQLLENYYRRQLGPLMKKASDHIATTGKTGEGLAVLEKGITHIRDVVNADTRSFAYAADFEQTMHTIIERLNADYKPRIATFGLPTLDDITNGVEQGDYIVLYGKSSSGKSTVKRRFISSFLRQGKRVLSITLENPKDIEVMQMHAMDAGVAAKQYLRYEMPPATFLTMQEQLRALVTGEGYGECIVEDRLEPKNMASVANLVNKHKIDIVVIDQLTLFAASREWKDIAPATTEARQFAIRGVPVIMLSQEDDKGQLKYGRAIYEDATKVIRVSPNPKTATDVKMLIVEKNRTGEMHGEVPLDYQPAISRVEEIPKTPPPVIYTDSGNDIDITGPKGW